jgi:hypothetical protein
MDRHLHDAVPEAGAPMGRANRMCVDRGDSWGARRAFQFEKGAGPDARSGKLEKHLRLAE